MVFGFGLFNFGFLDFKTAIAPSKMDELVRDVAKVSARTFAAIPQEMIRRRLTRVFEERFSRGLRSDANK